MTAMYTAALAAVLAVPALASAQNFVENGGFENLTPDGNFAPPWYRTPADFCRAGAHSGTYGACLITSLPSPQYAYIGQSLSTAVGQLYTVDLWARIRGFQIGSSTMDVQWGGVSIGTVAFPFTPGTNTWQHFTFNTVASTAATDFRVYNLLAPCNGGTACEDWGTVLDIDDVRVLALTETPEPATLALTITGLGVLAGMARRRRQASPRSPDVC